MATTVVYKTNELINMNVRSLMMIPIDHKYDVLRKFIADSNSTNLSSVVRQSNIPIYLKNRYGELTKPSHRTDRQDRTDQHDLPVRRKLCTRVVESDADKINEEIRDLLSKLSDNNKQQIFEELNKKEMPDACGQRLVDNIYLCCVDLSYIIHVYIDVVALLANKNINLYMSLISKMSTISCQPLVPEDPNDKRLRMGNVVLMSELYKKNCIEKDTILQTVTFLMKKIEPQNPEYLNLMCTLIKKTGISTIETTELFTRIAKNQSYDKRYRFMVMDLLEKK